MMYGILSSQSCLLSEISRKLDEKVSLKKVIDRLSRNLNQFERGESVFEEYIKAIKPQIDDKTILVIDGSDITKSCSKKMEGLAVVRDGSSGEYQNGYNTLGITAISSKKKLPIPVYSRIYSTVEADFVSEDVEVIEGLKFLSAHFSKKNIRTFDRGYDNNRYYKYLLTHSENFIIRAKKNRDVIYKSEKINIMTLAERYKGKYSLKFTIK